ncbi:5'-nucleotidase SurE [Sphingobium jiangsuense]|uniref:5'-nucleotidase SurE n=1 Tax=Sphingobium jiangsuense TaxID=870476 RepID=A0A7W6BSZ8_9SPHN|nr:5'/3'-nucleotidase SurE [Sphingobium jiangsuense]MBB3928193.1 5'-nucleotidase [Sphingobium jiangsuense]GLT00814.1 5'-nucleotidase SurE [Sphingobium jiangsuense]
MRILLTNDDGVHAPGLKVLEAIARTLSDDIWIVAPSEEQSGAGHSLTLTRPLRIRKHGERHYSVTGTPTDAVMMAVSHLMKDCPPDLVLSGVNRGANLAEDVTYSGTVSAAMEGAISGIRSIALSQVYSREGMGNDVPFACAQAWGEKVLRPLLTVPHDPRMLVNVNFPAIDPDRVKGVRVVRQGFHTPGRTKVVEGTDPRGFRYYWFGLGLSDSAPEGSDLEAIRAGYIAVTPLHFDLTHDRSMAALEKALG